MQLSTLAKRAASLALSVLLVFAASRALIRTLPGDPVETLLGETGTALHREALLREFHLQDPFLPAVAQELNQALHGDWGVSLISRQAIAPQLRSRLVSTATLAALAVGLGLALSLLLGIPAGSPQLTGGHRLADQLCTVHGAISAALPMPWLGPILLYAFAFRIGWFPVSGGLWLPALALAVGFSGLWCRLVRERVRETLSAGAATAARARGLPEWKISLKYGLMPASGFLLAYLGTQLGLLFSGAFITEVIFDRAGVGSWLVDAVLKRDYPVVEAVVFCSAVFALLGSALGDTLQAWVDPRDEII